MPNEVPPANLQREADDLDTSTVAPHPEEMKGTVTFKLGNWASMTATGRATPAGLISAALVICAVLVPVFGAIRRR
jgi:hypothetical protein